MAGSVLQHVPNSEMHFLAVMNSSFACLSSLSPSQEPDDAPDRVYNLHIMCKIAGYNQNLQETVDFSVTTAIRAMVAIHCYEMRVFNY